MKRVLALILSTLLFVTFFVGCSAPTTSDVQSDTISLLDQIIKNGKITIAVFSDVPPLGYMDDKNELQGIDVDVARELATALGVEVEFVPTTNANRIPYLQTEKVDIVIASFTMNSERRKVVEYTDPYFRGGAVLVVNSENQNTASITNLSQMKGMKIAVSKGSFNDELATKLADPSNEIIRFDNVSDLYQALQDGKADAIVEDVVLAGYNIENTYKNMKTVGDLLSVDSIGMGVRKGDQVFLNWLNGFVFDLLSSGKMDEICEKYGVDYYPVNYVY